MRVLLHAWGSRGDVQPMIALGSELTRRGHEVAIAAAQDFENFVASHGLAFEPVAVDLAALSNTGAGRAWLGGTARNPRDELRLMGRFLACVAQPLAEMMVRTAGNYHQIVTNPVLLEPAITLSQPKRVTCAMLQPSIASRDGRSFIAAPKSGQSIVNLIAGVLGSIAIRSQIAAIAKATCAASGSKRLSWKAYYDGVMAAHYLIASSPLITPRPDDWQVDAELTGFWQLPAAESYLPDPRLADFLAAGQAPVYLGFGSMSAIDGQDTTALVSAALRLAKVRAVVHRGRAGLDVESPDILVVEDIPHSWLFPRMGACIHHGGVGTTAAALSAGIGQVIVPHMGDQFFWGRRVHELGVGAAPIPRRRLTAESLAEAIRQASQASTRQRARVLSQRLCDEDGIAQAANLLEKIWQDAIS